MRLGKLLKPAGIAMELPRRKFLDLAIGAGALSVWLDAALALDYPTRPVHLIVGFPAGFTPLVSRLYRSREQLLGRPASDARFQEQNIDSRLRLDSRRKNRPVLSPLLGVKRTLISTAVMSAFDPKRTFRFGATQLLLRIIQWTPT